MKVQVSAEDELIGGNVSVVMNETDIIIMDGDRITLTWEEFDEMVGNASDFRALVKKVKP